MIDDYLICPSICPVYAIGRADCVDRV